MVVKQLVPRESFHGFCHAVRKEGLYLDRRVGGLLRRKKGSFKKKQILNTQERKKKEQKESGKHGKKEKIELEDTRKTPKGGEGAK